MNKTKSNLTNEEILTAAVEKAQENGLGSGDEYYRIRGKTMTDTSDGFIFSHDFAKAYWGTHKVNSEGESFDEVIESHWEVAKKCKDIIKKKREGISFKDQKYLNSHLYWRDSKEEMIDEFKKSWEDKDEAWQYHIKQLALAEDRLEYLARFL